MGKLHEVLGVSENEHLEGFYSEWAADGVFLRRASDDKLVVRHNFEVLTFYDPDEVDIFEISEGMNRDVKDSDIDLLLDVAWGVEGFGKQVADAFEVAINTYMNYFANATEDEGVSGDET